MNHAESLVTQRLKVMHGECSYLEENHEDCTQMLLNLDIIWKQLSQPPSGLIQTRGQFSGEFPSRGSERLVGPPSPNPALNTDYPGPESVCQHLDCVYFGE